RGDIATRWADHLRGKDASRAVAPQALGPAQRAVTDLRRCSNCLTRFSFENHLAEEYEIGVLLLRAMLSLTETEIDLGLLPEARAHLRGAKRISSNLVDSTRVPDFLRHGARGLTQRLIEVE